MSEQCSQVPDWRPLTQRAMRKCRCLICGERIFRGDKVARWPSVGHAHLRCLARYDLEAEEKHAQR